MADLFRRLHYWWDNSIVAEWFRIAMLMVGLISIPSIVVAVMEVLDYNIGSWAAVALLVCILIAGVVYVIRIFWLKYRENETGSVMHAGLRFAGIVLGIVLLLIILSLLEHLFYMLPVWLKAVFLAVFLIPMIYIPAFGFGFTLIDGFSDHNDHRSLPWLILYVVATLVYLYIFYYFATEANLL